MGCIGWGIKHDACNRRSNTKHLGGAAGGAQAQRILRCTARRPRRCANATRRALREARARVRGGSLGASCEAPCVAASAAWPSLIYVVGVVTRVGCREGGGKRVVEKECKATLGPRGV